MTNNEKLVWAAAYAVELNQREVFHQTYGGERNEVADTATAAEVAWSAVVRMRDALPAVEEGWGEDDEVTEMLREMIAN